MIKKSFKLIVIAVVALIIVIPIIFPIFLLFNDNEFTNIDIELHFNGDNAYNYVADQININTTHYRIPGTQGREDCAQYFITKFQLIDPAINFALHNFTILSVECQNVLFKINE
ncbi:MAG: hypothetical protein ACTSQR_09170, partial [Promethearchaeota archaeon]